MCHITIKVFHNACQCVIKTSINVLWRLSVYAVTPVCAISPISVSTPISMCYYAYQSALTPISVSTPISMRYNAYQYVPQRVSVCATTPASASHKAYQCATFTFSLHCIPSWCGVVSSTPSAHGVTETPGCAIIRKARGRRRRDKNLY